MLGMGAFLLLLGPAAIMKGFPGWRNYWGGFVYAPFAVVIGALFVLAVVVRTISSHKSHVTIHKPNPRRGSRNHKSQITNQKSQRPPRSDVAE